MFFDNLPLEITCFKCGKQTKETVKWLKAESHKRHIIAPKTPVATVTPNLRSASANSS
jgi:predicted Fe-S protein YdhL (DUF1289 family)